MSDMKITSDKIKTFDEEKISAFRTASCLADFGEKQNSANALLAENIKDLIKRVTFLEEENIQLTETIRHLADKHNQELSDIMRNTSEEISRLKREYAESLEGITSEMKSIKKELDRVRLSSKLNTSAIDRLNDAVSLAEKNAPDKK